MGKTINILIAPNSYKESADSAEAAGVFYEYLKKENFNLILSPLSDGGDGFLKVCSRHLSIDLIKYKISSPFGTKIDVLAGYHRQSKTAYIESAEVLGLRRIPADKRNPMHLSSAGMGELIRKLSAKFEVDKIVIGIGGTGTNDLGVGMLSELGLRLSGDSGIIHNPVPALFSRILKADWKKEFNFDVEVIIDVDNPLTGPEGATFIYGPQKGLEENDLSLIDSEFNRLVGLFENTGLIKAGIPLSGAGGGLAAGFQMFFNASLKTASRFILGDLALLSKLNSCDYVITGEGSFDEQSLYGKGTGIVISNTAKPVFLVCGKIKKNINLPQNIIPVELRKYFVNAVDSIRYFSDGIEKAAAEISAYIKKSEGL